MASINILDCVPDLQNKYFQFQTAMWNLGLYFKLTCTARSIAEQTALFAQGRQPLAEVNRLRQIARLYLLPEKDKAGNLIKYNPVTWTLQSKHIVDSSNPLARAFDLVLLDKNKQSTYDLKIDVDGDKIPDYIQAANVGKSVGLIPGAFFMKKDKTTGKLISNPDYPHYEV